MKKKKQMNNQTIMELEQRCKAAEEQLKRIQEEQQNLQKQIPEEPLPVKPRFLPIGSGPRKAGAERARDVMGL